jgi:hypothetical protein
VATSYTLRDARILRNGYVVGFYVRMNVGYGYVITWNDNREQSLANDARDIIRLARMRYDT